ncbi:MAG: fluoride exporter [Solirubrobacteraceae bacterium]|nr:fluoride exporter [Solirubrobacteraceae bacterium]
MSPVFLGGILGALARAAVEEAIPHDSFPWATLLVNVVGAGLLGWVVVKRPDWRPFVGTGVCGALTTFSTFQLELLDLSLGLAVVYGAASLAVGYAAVRGGEWVAAR